MLLFIIIVAVVVILSYDNAYLRGKNLQKFYRQTFKLNGTLNGERETFLHPPASVTSFQFSEMNARTHAVDY